QDEETYREVLTCPICLELLTDPKVTPCMHTICCGCLDKWINQKGQGKCPCPVCTIEFEPPTGGAKGLKGNYILNDMLDTLRRRLKKESDSTIRHCDICLNEDEKVKATSKCIDCDQYICKECTRVHSNIKALKDHKVIQITGDDRKDTSALLEMIPKRMKFCTSHPDEQFKFYCRSCNEVLCRDCCITTHSGHKCENLNENVKQDMKNIRSLIQISLQREENVNAVIQEMNDYKEKIERNASDMKTKITKDRQAQHELIDKYYNGEEAKVERFKSEGLKKVDAHISSLQMQNGITVSTRHLLDTQQQYGHPAEIINMRKEITKKTEEWSQPQELDFDSKFKLTYTYGTSKTPGLQFGQVSSLKNIIKENIKIEKDVAPFKDENIELHDLAILDNGEIVTAHAKDGINIIDPVTHEQKLHVTMDCSYVASAPNNQIAALDSESCTLKLVDNNGNIDTTMPYMAWSVAATPDGTLIAYFGGKISLMNSQTKTLINTLSVNNDFLPPCIAVNSRNEIILSFYSNNSLEVIGPQGDTLIQYEGLKKQAQLQHPWGTCTDPFDNIIVASYGTNSVHLLNSHGKFIKLLVTKEDNIVGPSGVVVDKQGRLIVGTSIGKLYYISYLESCAN
ncbi:unnamed protein product, partial [Owenia fusiformis]